MNSYKEEILQTKSDFTLKNLIFFAISTLCYKRALFNENCYKKVNFEIEHFKGADFDCQLKPTVVSLQAGVDKEADSFLEMMKTYIFSLVSMKVPFTVYLIISSQCKSILEDDAVEKEIFSFTINPGSEEKICCESFVCKFFNRLHESFIKLINVQKECKDEEKVVQIITKMERFQLSKGEATKAGVFLNTVETKDCMSWLNRGEFKDIVSFYESNNGIAISHCSHAFVPISTEKIMINKESSLFDSQEKIDSQLEKFLQPLKYDEIGSTQILDEQSVEKSLSQGKCEKMQNESRGLREIKNNNPCEEVKKSNWLKKNISGSDKVDKAEKKKALLNCECGDSTEDSEMFQCERCDGWVHCACYGFESDSDPRQPNQLLCYTCLLVDSESSLYDRMTMLVAYRRAIRCIWASEYQGFQKLAARLNCSYADAKRIEERLVNENIIYKEKKRKWIYFTNKSPEMVSYLREKYFTPSRWISHLNFQNYRQENQRVNMRSFLRPERMEVIERPKKVSKTSNTKETDTMKPLRI
uniref:Hop1 n=1 Tax=Schizosaccharomyces pombe TaxID=4896 RepID=A0A2I2LDX1_SCHPM|nr:Hop1 [Schizosaccharomyces pombe]SOT80014.1 Hop1 (splice variant 1) [Schizosaccharomyces pombe]